jgi:hypothetical protein
MEATDHQRIVLREYGYSDDMIDAMSAIQLQAEYQDAIDAGIETRSATVIDTAKPASEESPWRTGLERVGGALVAIAFFGFVAAYSISMDEQPPEQADVVVDLMTNTYAGIPCVVDGHTERPLLTRAANLRTDPLPLVDGTLVGGLAVARAAGFKADKKCEAADGFINSRNLISWALGVRHRWTEDGQWRW